MMQEILGDHADSEAFLALSNWARAKLHGIAELALQELVNPEATAYRGLPAGSARLGSRALRLGVFPVAANPLHWAHLLSGLAAVERFHLDTVLFVIAGEDPRKPAMASAALRHRMARGVLEIFRPLFAYSPVALGSPVPGERNVFRIMSFHRARPLHVFYLAGSDHFHRLTPQTGRPDTIQRLEEGVRKRLYGFDPRTQRLSAVFLDRGEDGEPVESFLDIRWLDALPLNTSSTRIRDALGGQEPLCELTALPFTAYCTICAHGMYRMIDDRTGSGVPRCERTRHLRAPC